MADLTDNELRALAYYSIGVSSEGGDVAYQLSFAGKAILEKDGSMMLKPVANSGYSIGTLQSDLGQRPKDARDLVDSFQDWSKSNHQNWTLNDHQRTQFTNDLQRTGHHIRDPNYEHDLKVHANIPEKGPDLNQEFKSHLNSYLNSDSGKKFIHQKDGNQIGELIDRVSTPIKRTELYQKSSQEIQAKIFAATAKAFNQNEIWGQDIIDDINDNKIKSIEDINKKISGFVKRDPKHPDQSTYMESGRDAALRGAETFNALRNASEANPLHA
ncbi:hypothetical protein ACDH50_19115, partial [Xanthomonas fragariae]